MASSKPTDKMLYLTLNETFGEQQAMILRNVVLYSKEKCTSIIKYTESNVNNKIIFSLETEMSAKEFAKFAAERLQAVNHTLLYGVWYSDKASCLSFHTLWDLSDALDWEHRTWPFDSDSDVFISESSEDDCLYMHNEEGQFVTF